MLMLETFLVLLLMFTLLLTVPATVFEGKDVGRIRMALYMTAYSACSAAFVTGALLLVN